MNMNTALEILETIVPKLPFSRDGGYTDETVIAMVQAVQDAALALDDRRLAVRMVWERTDFFGCSGDSDLLAFRYDMDRNEYAWWSVPILGYFATAQETYDALVGITNGTAQPDGWVAKMPAFDDGHNNAWEME